MPRLTTHGRVLSLANRIQAACDKITTQADKHDELAWEALHGDDVLAGMRIPDEATAQAVIADLEKVIKLLSHIIEVPKRAR